MGVNDELENDESDKLAINFTIFGCGYRKFSFIFKIYGSKT